MNTVTFNCKTFKRILKPSDGSGEPPLVALTDKRAVCTVTSGAAIIECEHAFSSRSSGCFLTSTARAHTPSESFVDIRSETDSSVHLFPKLEADSANGIQMNPAALIFLVGRTWQSGGWELGSSTGTSEIQITY